MSAVIEERHFEAEVLRWLRGRGLRGHSHHASIQDYERLKYAWMNEHPGASANEITRARKVISNFCGV